MTQTPHVKWSRFALFFIAACRGEAKDEPMLAPLPPLAAVELTDRATLVPRHPIVTPPDGRSPSDPVELKSMLEEGFGDFEFGPGEPHVTRSAPVASQPPSGSPRRLLARFAHLADIQLADDESPTRFAALDSPSSLDGVLRPQDAQACHVLNAAVRTLDAVHRKTRLDFVLLGGDNIDSAQEDELAWLRAILDGGRAVECDSGADDDLVAGPANDAKDPFMPVGLSIPWYWVTGNHDILVQGVLPVTSAKIAESIGSEAAFGTRDWRKPGGPVVAGTVPSDPRRRHLVRKELMSLVPREQLGVRLGPVDKAFYTMDIENTPLRFLILDTAAETGGSNGVIREGDLETVIRPALEQARAEGKWVILSSHHSAHSLGNGSDFGGTLQPDAVTTEAWIRTVSAYRNVLFSIVGHSHANRVRWIAGEGDLGWWEVTTSALSDYPSQMRIIEISATDDGWAALRATSVNFSTDGDPFALDGRRHAVVDFTSGWWRKDLGSADDHNVELWVRARPAP